MPVDEYLGALERELAIRFSDGSDWSCDTLYFGGGTPSRLGAEGVARLMSMLRDRVSLTPDAEVTIEANPEDISDESVAAWREAGVNRLSIGAQSFDERVLAWMHRTHDAAAIARAVDHARDGGIENLSLDLIFSVPEGVRAILERPTWRRAIDLEPSHVSLYGLTIEPHTPVGRWRDRGEVTESPDERYEADILQAHDTLTAPGFEHYEVSNFGLPARHSRHNSSYWTGAPYAGLGPSAHEFDGETARRWNVARRTSSGCARSTRALTPSTNARSCHRRESRRRGGLPRIAHGTGFRCPRRRQKSRGCSRGSTPGGRTSLAATPSPVLTPLGWLRLDALAADLTHVRSRY